MENLYIYNEKELKFYNVNKYKLYFPYYFIIILFGFLVLLSADMGLKFIDEKKEQNLLIEHLEYEVNNLNGIIEILNEKNSFDEINLRLMLEGLNIKFIDIVMAQSILESGNYSSHIFKETGNLFGMKAARLRPYTHFGEHRGHADYKGNWKLSVIDYALWQAREAKNVKTEEQYYFLLSKMYAEDPEYINKIKTIVNKNK